MSLSSVLNEEIGPKTGGRQDMECFNIYKYVYEGL